MMGWLMRERVRPADVDELHDDEGSGPARARLLPRLLPPPDLVAALAFVALVAAGVSLSGSTDSRGSGRGSRQLHPAPVEGVAVIPDGSAAVSASRDGTVKVWGLRADDDDEGRVVARRGAGFSSVALSPDGRRFIAGGFEGAVLFGDLDRGTTLATVEAHAGAVRGVACAPDGKSVATGGDDGAVRVWAFPDGDARLVLTGHEAPPGGLAYAPDGRTLATAGLDGQLILWDADTGSVRWRARPGLGPLRALAFSPDGRTLAAGGRAGLALVDARTGRTQHARALPDLVTSVRFIHAGATLASAGWDGAVSHWDVRGGALGPAPRRTKPGAKINALALCADGFTLLAGDQAGAVRTCGPEASR
jgi:WD40 repeat protein